MKSCNETLIKHEHHDVSNESSSRKELAHHNCISPPPSSSCSCCLRIFWELFLQILEMMQWPIWHRHGALSLCSDHGCSSCSFGVSWLHSNGSSQHSQSYHLVSLQSLTICFQTLGALLSESCLPPSSMFPSA